MSLRRDVAVDVGARDAEVRYAPKSDVRFELTRNIAVQMKCIAGRARTQNLGVAARSDKAVMRTLWYLYLQNHDRNLA